MQQRTAGEAGHGAETVDLCAGWRFAYAIGAPDRVYASLDEAVAAGLTFHDAKVPGNLELDLQRLGKLADPFYGMNSEDLRELEFAHVWYARRFAAEERPGCTAELVLEGVDCCASIYLNGLHLGDIDNMLVEHVFDVTRHLCEDNELFIHIRPARVVAREYDYPPNLAAFISSYDSLYIRKAPHMYGWDIMPRALSAGLWRPVSLRYRPIERFEMLYLETMNLSPEQDRADLSLRYDTKLHMAPGDDCRIRLEGACEDATFLEEVKLFSPAGAHRFALADPRLWRPNGYGEPHLYRVRATLLKNSAVLDERVFSFGVRTVRLERTDVTDAEGSGEFCFYVNGERIFAKGSNWVPLDAFHSRDIERVDRVIDLAVAAHCNILRCWGGNVYESDRFFDLCDAHGLMVWQDFAMACALYPEDEAFQRRLADEAVKVVRRLRQHPSLVLWAGDNECDQGYHWHNMGDPNRNVLTRVVLPGVLGREDPRRPYLPSSPYISPAAFRAGEQALPEAHLWGPRGYYKAPFYRDAQCHFASEIGYHGCPDPESIRRFISPERVWPCTDNPEWNLHSTMPVPGHQVFGPDGARVMLMVNQIRALFGDVPDSIEEFAFASQATQGEAKKTFVEMFRGGKWRRTGIIWWNLMDGWPQMSDAVVDYYFTPKIAYRYITRSQQHVALMFREPDGLEQTLVAANDTREDATLHYTVTEIGSGRVISEGDALAPANETTPMATVPYDPDAQRCYLIAWSGPLGEGRNHYLAGRPPFRLAEYRDWVQSAGLV